MVDLFHLVWMGVLGTEEMVEAEVVAGDLEGVACLFLVPFPTLRYLFISFWI